MPHSAFEEILTRIHSLQTELEREFESLYIKKQKQFNYELKKGKVIFDESIRKLHKQYRMDLWPYLRDARMGHVLTAPIVYSVIIPLVLLDLFVTLYQHICFRVYGIALVKRSKYLVIDRQHLDYLNIIEKLNCVYCGYGNGLIEYVREVFARTEQYWCPIKHASHLASQHRHAQNFVDFGDAERYRQELGRLRRQLQNKEEAT